MTIAVDLGRKATKTNKQTNYPSNKRMTRKCKIIVRNKVFECLTLLKIEIIEYGKMQVAHSKSEIKFPDFSLTFH